MLALRGAHVILACRDEEHAAQVVESIKAATGNQQVENIPLNLASFASIRQFAATFLEKNLPLHVLVNNAGIGWLDYGVTEDGIEQTMGVNYFGPFLLTSLLIEKLKESAPSRIINLSSDMHKMGNKHVADDPPDQAHYGATTQYSNSKLATVMFTRDLAESCRISMCPSTPYIQVS